MNEKSKTIIRQKRTRNYTIIPNDMLNNETLSFKAKGILTYLLSKPDNWNVYMGQLAKASKDGYEAVCSGVTELMESGYVFRRPIGGDNPGGWEYFVYDEPQSVNPFGLAENPTPENTDSVKPRITNKGDSKASKEKKPMRETSVNRYPNDEFIARLKGIHPNIDIDTELRKMDAWLLSHPKRQKTRAFITTWINRCATPKPPKDETPRLPNGEIDWAKVKPRD
jgi:hypothetical protein